MWYETIPAMTMIVAAIAATGVGMGAVQKFFNGGKVGHSVVSCIVHSNALCSLGAWGWMPGTGR